MPDQEPTQGTELLVRTWNDVEAAMLRQILAAHGIPCQVVSDVPHTILPFTVDGLGEIRILVPAERLGEAKELLAEHRRRGFELVDGGKPDSYGAAEDEDDEAPGEVESNER